MAPGWLTGKWTRAPARIAVVSILPPWSKGISGAVAALGRRHADGADAGVERNGEAGELHLAVADLDDRRLGLGDLGLEQAEARQDQDIAPVLRHLDVRDVEDQPVAGLGTLDIDRPDGIVDAVGIDHHETVLLALDAAVHPVGAADLQLLAGMHAPARLHRGMEVIDDMLAGDDLTLLGHRAPPTVRIHERTIEYDNRATHDRQIQ